jgi:putative PEP-CTERM system histidine kinase
MWHQTLSIISVVFSAGLAFYVFLEDRRSFVNRLFALGMIVLSAQELFNFLSLRNLSPLNIDQWQRIRFIAISFLPCAWLFFSLSFSRSNYKEYVSRWRWVLVSSFVLPVAAATLLRHQFFRELPALHEPSGWVLPLGWSGYIFHVLLLIASVLVLTNLENTFRASSGSFRWLIKFTVLGLAGIFAVRIFTASQAILFHSVDSSIDFFNTLALIASGVMIAYSLIRSRLRLMKADIYLSETVLYRSITFLIAGIYLIIFGVLAKAFTYFSGEHPFYIWALIVFVSLLGLTVILLSNKIRQKVRRYIYTHFRRPRYDYRKEWTLFTQRTASILDTQKLCGAVTKIVSEIFGVPCVTLWLADETKENVAVGGSTGLSEEALAGPELVRLTRNRNAPVDLEGSDIKWKEGGKRVNRDLFRRAQVRYAVPLSSGNEFLGIMTLNERVTKEPFSLEDFDLLRTISDQAAGCIHNIKITERLSLAKEMEAFQTMSTFFVHDLKNLASKLSLTVQNLPVHFDNPEFRKDALRAISESINKMNVMCRDLSLLREKIVVQPEEVDLNRIVTETLQTMNGWKGTITKDCRSLSKCLIDPELIQKVLTNLVLNANDAVGNGGEIRVATGQEGSWVILSVSDNGCGMSGEFMKRSLFRPFKTTKKQGMGIGLFHSKMIIEAHGGRIEVESEEGKGTTFRVFLPIGQGKNGMME